MIDLLLVQVSTSFLQYSNRTNEPQLGLYYIAEYVSKFGYKTKIKSYESSEPVLRNLLGLCDALKCRIVGFYIDSENLWYLRRLIPQLKHALPKIKIVIGGPQVTGNVENVLGLLKGADVGIVGEGEETMSELLMAIAFDNKSLMKIPGIAFKDRERIVLTERRNIRLNIDDFGYPQRELYALDTNVEFKSLMTGRGCLGTCAFCFEGSKTFNPLRIRAVDSVLEEFDYLVKLNGNKCYLAFLDDSFIMNRERTNAICYRLIDKYGGQVKWFCEARADVLSKNINQIPLLKQAGLIRVQLGGESGDQKVLDLYSKGIKLSQIETVVDELYKNGIYSVYINFIIGGANESLESFKKTLDFAKSLMKRAPGCVEVGSSMFTPYVGSPMYMMPLKYGINIIDKELLRGPDGYIPFVETEKLNQYKILQLKDIFDTEINKLYRELLPNITHKRLLELYRINYEYNASFFWVENANKIEKYKNYYESLMSNKYVDFETNISGNINQSIPIRTLQPVSDGESFFYPNNSGEYVKLEGIKECVFMLSAGKLLFKEIVEILKLKYVDLVDVTQQIIDVYELFDAEKLIVWKNSL